MEFSLPQSAQEIIDRYFNLQIAGKSVVCPYYMNLKRSKDLRALVGKGTPEEIELEAQIWAKLRGFDTSYKSAEEIREFLKTEDIGIDCSGFVLHVLNNWYKTETNKNIWKQLKIYDQDFFHRVAYFLKPVEKLGAEIITNLINSDKVELKDVLPGDLIRSKWKRKNAHHVMLVSKVTKDAKGKVKEIEYVNAAEYYGAKSGMRSGKIIIKNQSEPLEKQDWQDFDEDGVNHTYEGYLYQVEDNGIRRLKAMKEIVEKNSENMKV